MAGLPASRGPAEHLKSAQLVRADAATTYGLPAQPMPSFGWPHVAQGFAWPPIPPGLPHGMPHVAPGMTSAAPPLLHPMMMPFQPQPQLQPAAFPPTVVTPYLPQAELQAPR